MDELLAAAADANRCARVAASALLVVMQGGLQRELHVADLARLDVDSLDPVRRPPSHTRMRNYIGRSPVPSRSQSRSVWFESLNELHHLRDLLLDRTVVAVATQPMLVIWQLPGGSRTHFPDFCIEREDGSVTVCEITRRARLDRPEQLAQFALMASTARCCGWDFEIRTELPPQVIRNQARLRAYRRTGPSDDIAWTVICDRIAWPQQLSLVAAALGEAGAGKSAVLHLLAVGRLSAELSCPLTSDSLVWPATASGEGKPWVRKM